MPEFEWDDAKRQKTLEKHGLDFRRVLTVFDGPFLEIGANSAIEPRRIAIGPVENMLVAVVFTLWGDRIRLITARRARDNETRAYRARYS